VGDTHHVTARRTHEGLMAGKDDNELYDRSLEALASGEVSDEQEALFEKLAGEIEEPGLQDRILERYQSFGRSMLGDQLPSHVDPRIAKMLEPMLGSVRDVRIHTGTVASNAARAMDARAFAVGDRDIFIDAAQFNPNSREGGALIAHEIAHTRDAATGFALSAKGGNDTSAREAFAHEIEHKFAREWSDDGESFVRGDDEPAQQTSPDGMPKEPKVDKVQLAYKIVEVLEKQERSFNDRVGAWERG
jgi:hypothetical protein